MMTTAVPPDVGLDETSAEAEGDAGTDVDVGTSALDVAE